MLNIGGKIKETGDVFFWKDQSVTGRNWETVTKCNPMLIADPGPAIDELAKRTIQYPSHKPHDPALNRHGVLTSFNHSRERKPHTSM
jgi:hypothetical protein